MKDFYLSLIRDRVEQKVVQDQQVELYKKLDLSLILSVIPALKTYKLFQKAFTVVIGYAIIVTRLDSKRLGQIGFPAVLRTEDTDVHTITDK